MGLNTDRNSPIETDGEAGARTPACSSTTVTHGEHTMTNTVTATRPRTWDTISIEARLAVFEKLDELKRLRDDAWAPYGPKHTRWERLFWAHYRLRSYIIHPAGNQSAKTAGRKPLAAFAGVGGRRS